MIKTYNLKDIPEAILPDVGGKARGLFLLDRMGFNVPEAFIATDFSDGEDYSCIIEKYREFGEGPVSVRSSATLEDGEDFSAAGQFSTVLDVCGEKALAEAVKECVESLHSKTADNYSNSFLGKETGRMTVVIQRMIDPRCAGVIFTKAPMRPGFSLVEVVPGLGENLVSGKMSAQQYRVAGDTIEKMPENPILSKEEAVSLAAEGLNAECVFGMPLDLEWAIDKDGIAWWLQARPITVTESATINELDCPIEASSFVYTTGNIGEMMPGAVTPLNLSTNMYALDWGVKETYARFGACTRSLPPYSFIASYYNHMFFNMTNMYLACHNIVGSTKESMDIAICGHVLEGFPDNPVKDPSPIRKAINSVPFFKLVFSGEAAKKGMTDLVKSLKFDLDTDMKGIYGQIIDNFDAMKWAQYYHYCASYYSGGQSNMLLLSVEKAFENKNELQSLVAGCLTQIEDFESAGILRYMISLAKTILTDCPQAASFELEDIKAYMQSASAEVKDSMDAFMARHGHRGIREPEIRSLPWRDNPESFYLSLKSVLFSINETNDREERPWTEYRDEILSRFKGKVRRKMISGMIDRARKGVCYREFTKSNIIYVLDQFRKAYRKLASLMVEAGVLPDEDCIFFLLQDEVGSLLAGDRSLVKKALARRRLFSVQEKMKFPYCQIGVPVPVSSQADTAGAVFLSGTPVSRGIATGKARVVRSEKDASLLEHGEIMVVESTDIGWTPFYNMVAGMVTEIGSALSHGIVVAREYALPAVVNVTDAMNIIHDGDVITIDGNKGEVIIESKK